MIIYMSVRVFNVVDWFLIGLPICSTAFMIFESSHLASKPGNGWVQNEIVWNPLVKLASDVSVDLLHEVNKAMLYSFDTSVFARFYLNALLPETLTKGSDLSVGDSTRRFPANELVGDGTFMECALNSIGLIEGVGMAYTCIHAAWGQGYSHRTKEWPKCMTHKKISKGSNIRDWIASEHLPTPPCRHLLAHMNFQTLSTTRCVLHDICLLAYLGSWNPVEVIATWQFAWRPHVRQKLLFLYSIY